MALDPSLIRALNYTIDERIREIPPRVKTFRSSSAKSIFHLRNPEDFALGWILGSIFDSFRVAFNGIMQREYTPEEAAEVARIVIDRAEEIRNAIIGGIKLTGNLSLTH